MADQQQVSLLSQYFIRKDKEQVHKGSIRPDTTETYDLGASNRRYDNIYAKTITADTIGGTLGGQTWTYDGDMSINPNNVVQDTTLYLQNTHATYLAHLNVEGNILLGGTVDGVDIATFKTTYDSHIIDVDAHHDPVTVTGTGLTLVAQDISINFGTGTPTTVNAGDAGSWGSDGNPSHGDHEHPVATAAAGTIQPDASASEGTSTFLARADHTHAIVAAAAGTIQPDDAAAEGSSTSFARADHTHAIAAAAASTLDIDSTNLEGSSTSFSRADHTHEVSGSYNPGANDQLLETDVNGGLQLLRLGIGEAGNTDNWIQMTDGGGIGDATGLRIVFDETSSSFDYYGGDILFSDATVIATTDGDITFHPGGTSTVEMYTDVTLKSDHWVSQTTGWGITHAGAGDFRSLYADELHVQAFIADIYQAVVGGLIISKSRARLSRDFQIPPGPYAVVGVDTTNEYFSVAGDKEAEIAAAPIAGAFRVNGSTGNDQWWTVDHTYYDSGNDETDIYVTGDITSGVADGRIQFRNYLFLEDLEGWEDVQAFANNDWVRLRVIDTSGGGLIVADVWGIVNTYTDQTGGEQRYHFWIEDNGSVTNDFVYTGAIALDYGVSGDGVWEATVLDAAGAPYSQVTTWTTNPWTPANFTTHTRLGELTGLGFTGEYGLYAGQDTNYTYLLLTDTSFEAHGLDLKLYEGTTNTVWLDPATPKFVMGDGASTDTYASGNGIWMGVDSGTYKMRIGNSASGVFYYTGVDVRIYGDSGDYLKASGTGMEFISDGNAWFTVKDSTVTVGRVAGGEYVTVSSSGIYLYGGTYNTMQLLSSGDVLIGQSTGSIGNLWYDYSASTLYLRRGTTNIISLPSSGDAQIVGTLDVTSPGVITAGDGNVTLDANGITLIVGSIYDSKRELSFHNSSAVEIGELRGLYSSSYTYIELRALAPNISGNDAYVQIGASASNASSFGEVQLISSYGGYSATSIYMRGKSAGKGYCMIMAGELIVGNDPSPWSDSSGVDGHMQVQDAAQFLGGITTDSTDPAGELRWTTGDIVCSSGLYIGGTLSTNPANNMAIISGGLHVGDNSAPANDCITMTGDVYRNAWGSYTPSAFVGWATRTRTACYFKRVGKMVFCVIDIEGTAHATQTGCQVALPVQRNSSNVDMYGFGRVVNGLTTTIGMLQLNQSYTVAVFYPSVTGGNWSTTNNKNVKFYFWYEGA